MNKIIIVLFIVSSCFLISKGSVEEFIIPKDSIRMRIIANSNEAKDQVIKTKLVDELTEVINTIESKSMDINESRKNIEESIYLIENKLEELNINADISYGVNYFPVKEYKGYTYDSGDYESLVITIGEGIGDNWWCVLFPPLCLIDDNDKAVSDYEYSFYINNIIKKFS